MYKRQQYANWDLPIEKATIREVVEADGGDFDKIKLIPSMVTDEVTALKTKSVDAIWIFYGWAGVKTELEGLETDYFAFADMDPVFDFYTPVIIANNDFLENEPDTAKAFVKAVGRGYEYAAREPAVSYTHLIRDFKRYCICGKGGKGSGPGLYRGRHEQFWRRGYTGRGFGD